MNASAWIIFSGLFYSVIPIGLGRMQGVDGFTLAFLITLAMTIVPIPFIIYLNKFSTLKEVIVNQKTLLLCFLNALS